MMGKTGGERHGIHFKDGDYKSLSIISHIIVRHGNMNKIQPMYRRIHHPGWGEENVNKMKCNDNNSMTNICVVQPCH